jgi:hypothetical protein
MGLRAVLSEQFPLAFDMFRPLQLNIAALKLAKSRKRCERFCMMKMAMLFDIYPALGMQRGTSRYPTVPGKIAGRERQIPFDDASWNLATVLTQMKA